AMQLRDATRLYIASHPLIRDGEGEVTLMERDPLGAALDLVGDRWSLLIIRDLLRGRARFNDLHGSVVGIATNVLAARLRRLEEAGVVERHPYTASPPRDDYALTPKGHGLGVAVGALLLWGERYTK